MKKITLLSIIAATLLTFQGCDNKDTKTETTPDKTYSFSTGLTIGAYYKEGQRLAEEMSRNGYSFKVVSSEGGEQNGRRTTKGITDFSFIQKDTHNLLATIDKTYSENVNVVSTLGNEAIIFIVNKNSDIKTEKDIKENKVKIAISSKSSGANSSLDTLGKLNSAFSNKTIIYKDYDLAINELKAGTIDAVMIVKSNKVENDKLNSTLRNSNLDIINIEDQDVINNKINGKKVYTECNLNLDTRNVKTICTEALIISNKNVEQKVISKMVEVIEKGNFK